MKRNLCYLLLLMLSSSVQAQDSHYALENLMRGKHVADFEKSIGLMDHHYHNSDISFYADSVYRHFFDSVKFELELGSEVRDFDVNQEYSRLVEKTRFEINVIGSNKPSPPPGPVPESDFCEEFSFETGSFSNWQLTRGSVYGTPMFGFDAPFSVGPNPYHTVVSGGTDPITGLPQVNPTGGSYSVLLGNGTGTGGQAARMTCTFVVDANTAIFEYSYAVVFQSPISHPPQHLPYFTARVYDNNGQVLPCGEYAVVADSATANDFEVIMGTTPILFSEWETVVVNLTAYMGQSVTLEFTTGDCGFGAHYGYAYVDVTCGLGQPLVVDDFICAGEDKTLTAPPGVGSYLWNTGETTQSIVVNSGGTYVCTLTPLQSGSCDFNVTYNLTELNAPTADFLKDADSICINDVVNFTNQSSISPPETIVGYSWNFGNGTATGTGLGTITGIPNTIGSYEALTHTYNVAGTFFVELTATADNGCENTMLDSIVVVPMPAVDAGPDQFICDTAFVMLSGSGADSYQWDQGVQNGTPFLMVPGDSIVYNVIGTTSLGCVNSDQVLVQIYPLPQVDGGPDIVICEGNQATLSATGADTLTWNNGVVNNVSFIPTLGTFTYTVVGTDTNGCQNTDQADVTLNPLPIVVAGPDQTECDGTPITLNGSGSPNAVWSNGVVNNVPFIQGLGITEYVLYDTLSTGCFASDTLNVEILPNPIVVFPDTAICLGESVTYTGDITIDYVWTNGVADGVAFYPDQTLSYIVTGTAPNGCISSDTVQVVVHNNPIVDFLVIDSSLTSLNPVTYFENLSIGATSFEWNFGDGSAISTEFEPEHEFPYQQEATYEIVLFGYTDFGCMDSAMHSIQVTFDQTIFVPNTFTPNGDEYNQVFKPYLHGFDTHDYTLIIFNRWGEIIFETHDPEIGWDGTYAGRYTVQDGIYTWKIEVGKFNSGDKEVYIGHVNVIR